MVGEPPSLVGSSRVLTRQRPRRQYNGQSSGLGSYSSKRARIPHSVSSTLLAQKPTTNICTSCGLMLGLRLDDPSPQQSHQRGTQDDGLWDQSFAAPMTTTYTRPGESEPLIALTETAQFCSSKVLTAWLRH